MFPFDEWRESYHRAGTAGIAEWLSKIYHYKFADQEGEWIFDRDWDCLIILDGCRVDLMEEVMDDWEFINTLDVFTSLGSHSTEWMERTFLERTPPSNLIYISGNPFTGRVLSDIDSQIIDVWDYAWSDNLGTVPPRSVTDEAISFDREYSWDQMIIHYMQPHIPFLSTTPQRDISTAEFGQGEEDAWDRVQQGKLEKETAWQLSRRNLSIVLEDVDLLLNNIDAPETIITSDHGNAIGEHFLYGHPPGVSHPVIREVPWIKTSAINQDTYQPGPCDRSESKTTVDERLSALGYR
jgi:hypothetical protein